MQMECLALKFLLLESTAVCIIKSVMSLDFQYFPLMHSQQSVERMIISFGCHHQLLKPSSLIEFTKAEASRQQSSFDPSKRVENLLSIVREFWVTPSIRFLFLLSASNVCDTRREWTMHFHSPKCSFVLLLHKAFWKIGKPPRGENFHNESKATLSFGRILDNPFNHWYRRQAEKFASR